MIVEMNGKRYIEMSHSVNDNENQRQLRKMIIKHFCIIVNTVMTDPSFLRNYIMRYEILCPIENVEAFNFDYLN